VQCQRIPAKSQLSADAIRRLHPLTLIRPVEPPRNRSRHGRDIALLG
jgi:hypothetical protein